MFKNPKSEIMRHISKFGHAGQKVVMETDKKWSQKFLKSCSSNPTFVGDFFSMETIAKKITPIKSTRERILRREKGWKKAFKKPDIFVWQKA